MDGSIDRRLNSPSTTGEFHFSSFLKKKERNNYSTSSSSKTRESIVKLHRYHSPPDNPYLPFPLSRRNSIKPNLFPYLAVYPPLCFYYFLMRPRSTIALQERERNSASVATFREREEEEKDDDDPLSELKEARNRKRLGQKSRSRGSRGRISRKASPFAASIPRREEEEEEEEFLVNLRV